MRLVAAALLLLAAQPGTPTFEVASIRPLLGERLSYPVRVLANGRLRGQGQLRTLIQLAYGLQPYEKIVAEGSAESGRLDEWFDVAALPFDAPSPPSRADVMAMTRQMLADRFGLKVRVETELVSASVLRVIKPGVYGRGLRPAPEGCDAAGVPFGDARFDQAAGRNCYLTFFGERLRGTVTLDGFAQLLSFWTQRPLLNRTDLQGLFAIDLNVALRLAFGPSAPKDSDAPALVDGLRDQMGLSARVEPDQPIRRFVVEHIGPLVEN